MTSDMPLTADGHELELGLWHLYLESVCNMQSSISAIILPPRIASTAFLRDLFSTFVSVHTLIFSASARY